MSRRPSGRRRRQGRLSTDHAEVVQPDARRASLPGEVLEVRVTYSGAALPVLAGEDEAGVALELALLGHRASCAICWLTVRRAWSRSTSNHRRPTASPRRSPRDATRW